MPLSLMRLVAGLDGIATCDIIDGNLDQHVDPIQTVLMRCSETHAMYLGITIMPGPQLQRAIPELIRIRQARPDLTVIAGGYFPSIQWEQCVSHDSIDYVVIGEGDRSIRSLIEVLESGGDPQTVPGIAWLKDGKLLRTPTPPLIDPDDLPGLPYNAIDIERYVASTHLGHRTLSHHSSMGCPFSCHFCAVPLLAGGGWKGESARRLLDITEHLVRTCRIDALEFHDNNFFVDEDRVATYCEGLLNRNFAIRWWGEGRIDTLLHFRPETWTLMAKSGLAMVFMGAESGSDETLGLMNKGGTLTTSDTLKLVALAARHGIVPELSFICGNPPDPARDIRKTIRFIREIKQVNPATEIILYRYDPVPCAGAMWNAAAASGFRMPTELEQWVDDRWSRVHRRRQAELPWLNDADQQYLRDFETVLNAYYLTTTSRRRIGMMPRLLLRLFSFWRYHAKWYRWPVELRMLQKQIRYQRPETSGF